MIFDIPIVVNNFNRLTTTRKLCDDLSSLGYRNIHILDNNSTYPPLLEWYNSCPYTVKRLDNNSGQLAIYNSDYINQFSGWVAYSDSDISLGENTPPDFIEYMIKIAEKYNYNKVGLALQMNDLPDTPYGNYVKIHEAKFWKNELEKDVFVSDVDTTFCIIKVGVCFDYKALRIGGKLTAKHLPWYLDYSNLSQEEKYVIDNSDSTFSTTKRFINSVSL